MTREEGRRRGARRRARWVREWCEALDTFFPSRCGVCPRHAENGAWCAEHALPRSRLRGRCLRCSARLPRFHADAENCLECAASARSITSTIAAFDYREQEAIRAWVLALKHGGRSDLAVPLGRAVSERWTETKIQADLLLPVPLHPWRLFERGYDQAWALARAVERDLKDRGSSLSARRILRRVRDTAPQGEGGADSRRANVGGAFAVRRRWRRALRGTRCVLVDDVVTSGATLEECARALRRAGVREVHALVVATAR